MARKSNKTEAVMRLITGSRTAVNPIIDEEFKEEVIKQLSEADMPSAASSYSGGTTEINVTSEIVSGWLPEALRRFNCCTCTRCTAEASVEAFKAIPEIKMTVRSREDLEKAEKLRREKKQEIMMQLVKIAVRRKSLPKHET